MQTYGSTFISGTGPVVEEALKRRFSKSFRVTSWLDGLVIYETSESTSDIAEVRFFNNSFVIFKYFKKLGSDPLNQMIKGVVHDSTSFQKISLPLKNRKKFKIVLSLENQMVSGSRRLLDILGKKISKETRLTPGTEKSSVEFWFLARSEGVGFFGLRVTYPRSEDIHLAKGQLRPQLAHILCLVSEPDKSDVFLDPFAGSGAIPHERAKSFPFRKIIAIEKDRVLVQRLRKLPRSIEVMQMDALALGIPDSSIDKIVTDPPWGIFEKVGMAQSEFYLRMLKEFSRVLRDNGIAVVLIGDKVSFDRALHSTAEFRLLCYNILVSGKKAGMYKLRKVSSRI